MGNSSIESETQADRTSLVCLEPWGNDNFGNMQRWPWIRLGLEIRVSLKWWDVSLKRWEMMKSFFPVDLDFIFGGSSGYIWRFFWLWYLEPDPCQNVTRKKSSIMKCQGFLKQSDHQKSADAMPLGPPNRQLLGFNCLHVATRCDPLVVL